jgi:hypothetical protein
MPVDATAKWHFRLWVNGGAVVADGRQTGPSVAPALLRNSTAPA